MNTSRGPYRHFQGPAESMPVTVSHPLAPKLRDAAAVYAHQRMLIAV